MHQDVSNPFGDTAALSAPLGSLEAARRPGGLTAVCVIAIILGSMGLMSSVIQGANLAGGQRIQGAFSGMGQMGVSEELRGVQDEFNEAVATVTKKYFWVNTTTVVVHLIVASLLIYGGALTLRQAYPGYRVLRVTSLVAIVFEIARAIPYLMIQWDMLPVLEEYMPRMMMESAGASGDQAAEAAEAMARIGAMMARLTAIFGMVFFCGWCLVKVVFYSITNRYLKKADIRRLFVAVPVETS